MLTKSRVVQLSFMLCVLLALFFWKTFETPKNSASAIEDIGVAKVSLLRCDYRDACEFIAEQGTFYLSIKNLPIKPEEWINFELHSLVKNMQVTSAKIISKSMFMGKIPVVFKKSEEQLFVAKGIVGACITDEMIWALQITVENGELTELLSFDFMVVK